MAITGPVAITGAEGVAIAIPGIAMLGAPKPKAGRLKADGVVDHPTSFCPAICIPVPIT
jgi:hypothetical protein